MGSSRPLRQGEEIARGYRVLNLLRRGGALDVYDAWSEERDCRCVVKALRADRVDDRKARLSLLREGRLLLSFSHPHFVRAYELLSGRRPALVLETLTGVTLARLIDDNPHGIPERDLLFLALHLCSALRYLHWHGFLHLDVKPSNVISQAGIAKLLDLSVARRPGQPHRGLGTRAYMSPEQITGAPLTHATDVWGLGVLLYEAATGKELFDGRSQSRPAQLARSITSVCRRRKLPFPLGEVIDACLQRAPAARPTVREVADALRALV
jgi:eukaryotic-like serine/threonine-protein kinase